MNFSELLFFITIYSFLGWCVEVVYHTVNYGEFSNRGFVGGPVCTIYGVGFTGITILLSPFRDNVFVLFPVSVFDHLGPCVHRHDDDHPSACGKAL